MDTEIVAGGRAKRRFRTLEEKRRIVEATLGSLASMAASLVRRYGLNANQQFHWKKPYQASLLGSGLSSRSLNHASV
jgi:transposase-like protein